MQEINGDPQFTTQGVYQQADDISPGPQEGQRGVPVPKLTPKKRQRGRKSVAERRGRDETRKKDRTGRKAKNAGQLRNPMERKRRQMGPAARARDTAAGAAATAPAASLFRQRRAARESACRYSGGTPSSTCRSRASSVSA